MANTLPTTMEYFDNLLGEQLTDGGGSGGETWNTVFEGSVTTEASDFGAFGEIQYESLIDADKIKVTFNGTEYECPKMSAPAGANAYGGIGESGPDFSEYPFAILSAENQGTVSTTIYTQTAGTYTLKIEEPQSGGSSDFSTANVTITNNSDTDWQTQFASLENIGVGEHPDVIVCNTQGIPAKSVNDYKIIMYKNYTGLRSQSTATVEVSGNAELIGRVIAITGDCTITIS